jgi:hypothetical protein
MIPTQTRTRRVKLLPKLLLLGSAVAAYRLLLNIRERPPKKPKQALPLPHHNRTSGQSPSPGRSRALRVIRLPHRCSSKTLLVTHLPQRSCSKALRVTPLPRPVRTHPKVYLVPTTLQLTRVFFRAHPLRVNVSVHRKVLAFPRNVNREYTGPRHCFPPLPLGSSVTPKFSPVFGPPKENNGESLWFQSIGCMDKHRNMSAEELRLGDYQMGWRFPDVSRNWFI